MKVTPKAGVTALVLPINGLDPRFLLVDMPMVLGVALTTVALAALLAGVPRWAGGLLLAAYGGYVALML